MTASSNIVFAALVPVLVAASWTMGPASAVAQRITAERTAAIPERTETNPQAAAAPAPPGASAGIEELDRVAAQYREYWERHPHGQWLLRILPVRLKPSQLPEAASEPARLTARYCVQCHALPDPAMHGAQRWERVVDRMLPRMRGEGNQGRLMHEMMQGLQAPDAQQARMITDYLVRHAQRPLPLAERAQLDRERGVAATVPGRPALSKGLATEAGRMFQGACTQCHELPDPARHRAQEWPAVVERMQANMQWMNRVVGSGADPGEPRFDPRRITTFLQAFSSDGRAAAGPSPRDTGSARGAFR